MAAAFDIPDVKSLTLGANERKLVAFIVWAAYFNFEDEVVFTKRLGLLGLYKTFTIRVKDLRPILVRLFGDPVVEL